MKYNLSMSFNSLEELNEFVCRLNIDASAPHFTTAQEITKAMEQGDFQSLADTKVVEEAPTLPQTLTPVGFHMSRDEVKTYCTVARTEKGVNIKQILQGLGVGSFKELPDDKLEALYDAVKSARGD